MEAAQFDRLVGIMNTITSGDPAGVVTLYTEFGGHVAAQMRSTLRRLGVHHVAADDFQGLVIDGCLELAQCAGGWQPAGGATPWHWARRRLDNLASRLVGQHADAFDPDRHDVEAPPFATGTGDPATATPGADLDLLARCAASDSRAQLLIEALVLVASERDRAVFIEMRVQAAEGDPSPATTVARRYGLSPANARQISCRVRNKLRALPAAEPRFAPLLDLPFTS